MLKPFAFVLMPFEPAFDDIYRLGIQAAANELDVVAERVDEQVYSESILERIYRQIESADFIIADMTGRNPNVFYEVGYAHAREKICTLLTQNADDIPFDLKHHRHLIYGGSITQLKSQLVSELRILKDQIEQKNSKTISVDKKNVDGILVKNEWSAHAEVEITLDLNNHSSNKSPEIEAIYFYTGLGWEFTQENQTCASTTASAGECKVRHFVRAPVARLSPGAWAPIVLKGRKRVWSKFAGDELKDKYRMAGKTVLEIVTSEGNYRENINIDVEVDEFPF